jgi:ribosome biogenesis protein MAK21
LPPNLACAILFLISEVSKTHKDIFILGNALSPIAEAENSESEDDGSQDDSKPSVVDVASLVKNSNMTFDAVKDSKVTNDQKDSNSKDKTAKPEEDDVVEIKEEKHNPLKEYDPLARNPVYCGAEFTLSYELTCLIHHFHPSVALFSQTLLNRQFIKYDGNPLKDFTVGRFLERFVYRNAKQKRVMKTWNSFRISPVIHFLK